MIDRQQCAYQFEIQTHRLKFHIKQRLRNNRYILIDEKHNNQEVTAIVLVTSFDYYTYRLNRGKHRIDLIIVAHHNAVVPVRTVCINDSREYQAGTQPDIERPGRKRRNADEVKLLVSELLIGAKSAQAELEAMDTRTRQRYIKMRNEYLRPRVGRPWSS